MWEIIKMESQEVLEYKKILDDIVTETSFGKNTDFSRFLTNYPSGYKDVVSHEDFIRFWHSIPKDLHYVFGAFMQEEFIDGILLVLRRLDGYKIEGVDTTALMGEFAHDFESRVGRS
jgi:hypothetical protein